MNVLTASTSRFALSLAALAGCFLAQAQTHDVLLTTFDDGTFSDPTPWTISCLTTNATYLTPTSVQLSTGGNPGYCRKQTMLFATTPKSYFCRGVVLALSANATYTPGSGAYPLHTLKVSFDERRDSIPVNARYMLLKQGTKYFMGPNPGTALVQGSWVSSPLTSMVATDFNEINMTTFAFDTTSHPDFVSGSTITFGFMTWADQAAAIKTECINSIDNWHVELYVAVPNSPLASRTRRSAAKGTKAVVKQAKSQR